MGLVSRGKGQPRAILGVPSRVPLRGQGVVRLHFVPSGPAGFPRPAAASPRRRAVQGGRSSSSTTRPSTRAGQNQHTDIGSLTLLFARSSGACRSCAPPTPRVRNPRRGSSGAPRRPRRHRRRRHAAVPVGLPAAPPNIGDRSRSVVITTWPRAGILALVFKYRPQHSVNDQLTLVPGIITDTRRTGA